MIESNFQTNLIKEIRKMFPGCIVLKTDGLIQGFPDLTILYKNKWATLECKKDEKAERQPNQPYYVKLTNHMSFSRFVEPNNKEEVLHELQQTFLV